MGGGVGENPLTFGTEMPIMCLFGVANILWSEISRPQKYHLQVLKFRVGDISRLQYLTPSHFLSIKVFFLTG